jgi:hypothetical protein
MGMKDLHLPANLRDVADGVGTKTVWHAAQNILELDSRGRRDSRFVAESELPVKRASCLLLNGEGRTSGGQRIIFHASNTPMPKIAI